MLIHTHHTGLSTSFHSSCAASRDSHNTACYSDCQSTLASAQPTSYVAVDDQQPGTSRQLIFNPPSVAASQQEESQHNTSGLSSLIGAIPSVLQYQQMDTTQSFTPSQLQPARHQCHLPLIIKSQNLSASPASRVSPNQ